nr:uncharacterized protein LOC117996798 [Maniola hyperantus]
MFCNKALNKEIKPEDWTTVELLAEEHPYIVAILNQDKEYICTGTVLDKRTVLTSGGCINPDPHYVVVGTAVLGQQVNNNNIFKVAFARVHGDYVFEIQGSDPNISQMHSNIGLVFTARPILEFFVNAPPIGNYYASELREKKMIMIGFGHIKTSGATVLQNQAYYQIPCKNPKWYYCICGLEYADISYVKPFGEGAPVLYGDEVVGIAASPSDSLGLKNNIIYNVFTVIGPYTSWIEKSKSDSSVLELKTKLRNAIYVS